MMRSVPRRIALPLVGLFALSLQAGCPKPQKVEVAPKQTSGDLLKLSLKSGDKLTGKLTVRLERSESGKKRPKVFALVMKEEHTVASAEGGVLHMTAAFVDIEPQGESSKERKDGEAMARALSTSKISFDLTARGDVTNFDISLPAEVAETRDGKEMEGQMRDAKQIAQAVYGADRGPIFDPSPIETGKSWPIRATIPIPQGGTKSWELNGTYDKNDGGIAEVTLEGKVSGESRGTQLTGELKGRLKLNVKGGYLTYQDMDTTSTFRGKDGSETNVHVHVTWEGDPPAAAPASPPSSEAASQLVN
jgi:hypothetical protein